MSIENKFYAYAMKLYIYSGYVDDNRVIYKNNSAQEVFYSDHFKKKFFSAKQRQLFGYVSNISFLFNLDNDSFDKKGETISFFSVVINSFESERSQIAYDFHNLISSMLQDRPSIIIFLHEKNVMITAKGFKTDVYLSDWYSLGDINETLPDLLDISNFSFRSAKEFYFDFIYLVSRWYYFHTIPNDSATIKDPLYDDEYTKDSTEEIDEGGNSNRSDLIREEYGDDYIEQSNANQSDFILSIDLDMLSFINELEENDPDENITNPGENTENSGQDKDKYELEHIDRNILDDPILLLKYLNDIEKKRNNKE